MKPRGINHALPVTLVYLVIYTDHFLQGLEEDAESMALNVAKKQRDEEEKDSVTATAWVGSDNPGAVPSPLGMLSVGKPQQRRHATWRVAGVGHTGIWLIL